MKITIDKYSGFCFGVVYAIQMAEDILRKQKSQYCLGDIVHNNKEVERLNAIGLKMRENNKVMFISAERFMYHFVKSIRNNEMVKFKDSFRTSDLFIIDDIQFVIG